MEFLVESFNDLCKPLKDFGVSFVRFVRVYQNRQLLTLCNTDAPDVLSPSLLGLSYDESKYPQDISSAGFQLIDYTKDSEFVTSVYKHANPEYTDYICFIAQPLLDPDSYTKSSSMFKRFYYFLLDSGADLISAAQKDCETVCEPAPPSDASAPDMEVFSSNTPIKRFFINENCYLTKRECECLAWLGSGKTYEEVSLIMGTALRTVINHVESVKNKLNLRTINEIIRFSIQKGFPELFVA